MGWLYACRMPAVCLSCFWLVALSISVSGEPWNVGVLAMLLVLPGKMSFQR